MVREVFEVAAQEIPKKKQVQVKKTLSLHILTDSLPWPMQDALTEIGVLSYLRPRIGTGGIGVIEIESREGQIL